MASEAETLVRELVATFPGLAVSLERHLDDNFGELLPYVFLADVERYVLDAYRAETQPGAPVRAILDYLEESFVKGGEEVKELISVSFLELLPSKGEPGSGLRDLLGPELSSEAKRVA